jgi:hypothetical protein
VQDPDGVTVYEQRYGTLSSLALLACAGQLAF